MNVNEFETLLQRVLDGEASPDEIERFEAALSASEEFRRRRDFEEALRGRIVNAMDEPADMVARTRVLGAMLATGYINQNPTKISGAILMEPGGFVWKDVEDYMGRVMKIEFLKEPSNDLVYLDQFVTGRDHNVLDYKYALSQTANTILGTQKLNHSGVLAQSAITHYWNLPWIIR